MYSLKAGSRLPAVIVGQVLLFTFGQALLFTFGETQPLRHRCICTLGGRVLKIEVVKIIDRVVSAGLRGRETGVEQSAVAGARADGETSHPVQGGR